MSSSLDFDDLRASTGALSRAVEGPASTQRATTRPLRVVVVDDNFDAADTLAMLLEVLGHQAWTAQDGPGALAMIDARRPDAVLLDIGLPGMDGFAVARAARTRPAAQGVYLAALSGWGQADDRRRAREAGFDAHLVKPVGPEELASLISAALRRRGA